MPSGLVLLAQFCLCVLICGLKPHSFHVQTSSLSRIHLLKTIIKKSDYVEVNSSLRFEQHTTRDRLVAMYRLFIGVLKHQDFLRQSDT